MEFLLGPYHGRLRNINENESERRTLALVHFTTVSCYCVTRENRNMSQLPEHGCVKSQLSKFQGYYRTDNKTFLRKDKYKITCRSTLTYHPVLLATARIFSTNQQIKQDWNLYHGPHQTNDRTQKRSNYDFNILLFRDFSAAKFLISLTQIKILDFSLTLS